MMSPDPQQFFADSKPATEPAWPSPPIEDRRSEEVEGPSESDATELGPGEPMPDGTDIEDWAVDSLYTCERCKAKLPPVRMLRYCPRCGHHVATHPLPAAVAEPAPLSELEGVEPLSANDGDVTSTDEAVWQPIASADDRADGYGSTPNLSKVTRADILAVIAYWQSLLELFPEDTPAEEAVDQTTSEFEAAMRGELPPIPIAGVYHASSIVTAYASAIYRLGRAYETRLGGDHNDYEAARCFFKAARLGNADALNRLRTHPTIGQPHLEDLHA